MGVSYQGRPGPRAAGWLWSNPDPAENFSSLCAFSSVGKESACNAGDPGLIPGLGRLAGEGIGYPLQYSKGFPCGSAGKESTCNVGNPGSTPGLGRFPGRGKSYPLECFGLENSMDCIAHGVTKSQIQLSDFHFHNKSCDLGRITTLSAS